MRGIPGRIVKLDGGGRFLQPLGGNNRHKEMDQSLLADAAQDRSVVGSGNSRPCTKVCTKSNSRSSRYDANAVY